MYIFILHNLLEVVHFVKVERSMSINTYILTEMRNKLEQPITTWAKLKQPETSWNHLEKKDRVNRYKKKTFKGGYCVCNINGQWNKILTIAIVTKSSYPRCCQYVSDPALLTL